MAVLSDERRNEIGYLYLMKRYRDEGMEVNPSQIVRRIRNEAKALNIDVMEAAEFCGMVMHQVVVAAMNEVHTIKPEKSSIV